MIGIINQSTDPYFNLATEEYFLKNFDDDVFILWQSTPSIIIGKHQNTYSEINFPRVLDQNIDVIRRISGGGTVYHDRGNLNFTFIFSGSEGHLINFERYTSPIIAFLKTLGIEARFEGKNDLRIKGLKFSGNAEHVYKNKVMHHGTLLYNCKINELGEAIKTNPGRYHDKSVQSNRTQITNICDHLDEKIDFEEFQIKLFDFLLTHISSNTSEYKLNSKDILEISNLANSKYRSWEWNFGYSPEYSFQNSFDFEDQNLQINIFVKNGIIQSVEIAGDAFTYVQKNLFIKSITNNKHDILVFEEALKNINVNLSRNKIASVFF